MTPNMIMIAGGFLGLVLIFLWRYVATVVCPVCRGGRKRLMFGPCPFCFGSGRVP